MRSSVGARCAGVGPRGHAEPVSRFTCASSQASASCGSIERSRRFGLGELDVDRELVGRDSSSRSPATRPASRTSSSAASSAARRSAVSRDHDARRPRCASSAAPSLFALRTSPSTSAATAYTRGSPSPATRERRSASGHAARCTEPSRHHDHTSSVTNGRCGAKSRSSASSASASAAARRGRAVVAARAVRALLHQLEVVVAEAPEEPLGALERPRVVVRRRTTRVASSTSCGERARASNGRAASVIARRRRARLVAHHAERELRRVEDLDREPATDLHLALVERGVDARAAARRPVAHRVGAVLLEQRHRRDDVALATSTSSCGRGRGPTRDRRCRVHGSASCSRCDAHAPWRTARCG